MAPTQGIFKEQVNLTCFPSSPFFFEPTNRVRYWLVSGFISVLIHNALIDRVVSLAYFSSTLHLRYSRHTLRLRFPIRINMRTSILFAIAFAVAAPVFSRPTNLGPF